MEQGKVLPAPETQLTSVMVQLEHLRSEICELDDTINLLQCRLTPILPPASPVEVESEKTANAAMNRSPMMDEVTGLTHKVRRIKAFVIKVTGDLEI